MTTSFLPRDSFSSTTEVDSQPSADHDLEKCNDFETEPLMEEIDLVGNAHFACKTSTRRLKSIFLLVGVLVGLLLGYSVGRWTERSALEQRVFQHHSIRSPMKRDITPRSKLVRFNGTLDGESPYRGKPNTELDARWSELGSVGFFAISEQDVRDIGASPDAMRMPDHLGGQYFATAEFTHKMHCLNLIRKSLFTNYDYYKDPAKTPEFSDPADIVEIHLSHCMEMLRQDIMCSADDGILTAHWVKRYPRPYSNFNVWKVCRNWEDVHNWAKAKASKFPPVLDDEWVMYRRNDSVVWPRPPQPDQFPDAPPFP